MDSWAPVTSKRFDGEDETVYRWRAARIEEIITGFRRGLYRGVYGEEMERELMALQSPDYADRELA